MWELFASSVLTFPGWKAIPALVANQTGVAVIDGTARSWTLAGHAASSRPSAGRAAQSETVIPSCSPTRRSWSATCRASGVCQTQAGQRCGRWKVSAKMTNAHSSRLAGVQFLRLAELSGWR
jgi:hypothetical protein